MSEVVTISKGDTMRKLLKIKKGLKDHEVNIWLHKVRSMNPHISNLERIYPGEKVLIPDTLLESVSDDQIWQNAFSRVPRELESRQNDHAQLFLTFPGTRVDTIAEKMFAEGPFRSLPLSTKRAVLIHNNPDLINYLDTNQVPGNMLVDITPLKLNKFDKFWWQTERPQYMSHLKDLQPMTQDMFQQVGPEDTYILARLIQALQEAGAAVETKDVINGMGFGVGGVSGLAASGEMAVANINALARQMYADAAQKFGRKAAASVKKHHLAQMAKFVQSHPNYPKLMRHFKKMPELLLPMPRTKLVPPAAANVNSQALARHFSKQYFQAFRRWPSSQYMQTIAKQLNGRVNMFKALGRHATWYVPAVLGVYNVYDAAPEVRMRTLFEEGFAIVGGYIGTELGSALGGFIAISVLGLGPLGMFLMVFLCATGLGLYVSHKFRKGAAAFNNYMIQLDQTRIYNSPEQFLEYIK